MVDLKKEKISYSFLDNKRQKLLDELSELMDKAGGEYGPFFMEKLHARLDIVVENFNAELNRSLLISSECRAASNQLSEKSPLQN